jgi:acetyl esterase/lipase
MLVRLSLLALSALLAAPMLHGQERLDAANERHRAERLAITGDLGAPALPPVLPGGPRNTMLSADRVPVFPDTSAYAGLGEPTVVDAVLPAGEGGTGTDKPEVFQYQLPAGYDPDGPLLPLIVAYHGYGASAKSVAINTTIDDECNARGWLYVAPTGIDDQLFGAPISQQNTEAAILWMVEQFQVDPDRIAMVGFSMGGGIAMNFAARRRDPEGLLLAGIGVVSATSDWVMTYASSLLDFKEWMKNEYNFGGSPGQQTFAYRRASGLAFDGTTYIPEPLPGELMPEQSMARNLGATAVWHVWDVNDSNDLSRAQNPVLSEFLLSLGGDVTSEGVTGTVDGQGFPATHSWAVLDEVAFFDWFEHKRAVRRPLVFDALLDGSTAVGHVSVTQREGEAFSRLVSRDGSGAAIDGADNVARARLDAVRLPEGTAAFALRPVDGLPAELELLGFDEPLARLEDAHGRHLLDVASDPQAGSLIVTLAPAGAPAPAYGVSAHPAGRPVHVVTDPTHAVALSTSPDPAAVGATVTLALDAGPGHPVALVWTGPEGLLPLPAGVTLGVVPSAGVIPLLLPPNGRVELPATLPDDPALAGLHLHVQAAGLLPDSRVDTLSNVWLARLD